MLVVKPTKVVQHDQRDVQIIHQQIHIGRRAHPQQGNRRRQTDQAAPIFTRRR
jgi:hypothetical protein